MKVKTVQERKQAILNEMVIELLADERLAYLRRAQAMLDAGRWWARARVFAAGSVDAAFKDYGTEVEAFREIVQRYQAGILKGCERVAASLERRSKGKARTRKAA